MGCMTDTDTSSLDPTELEQYRGMTWGHYDVSRLFATIDALKAEVAELEDDRDEHVCYSGDEA